MCIAVKQFFFKKFYSYIDYRNRNSKLYEVCNVLCVRG